MERKSVAPARMPSTARGSVAEAVRMKMGMEASTWRRRRVSSIPSVASMIRSVITAS